MANLRKTIKKFYNDIDNGTMQKKYTLLDINMISDILRAFANYNAKEMTTVNSNVMNFFMNEGFKVGTNGVGYYIQY